jgi:carbamoyltransferase
MHLLELNISPKVGQLRMFGLLWFPLFCGVVGWIVWRSTGSYVALYAAGGAAGLTILLGLATPKLLKPLFVGLMIISFPIGWVVSHVLMALMYYALITPFGLVMRLLGHDPMNRKLDASAGTYWSKLPPAPASEQYFRQY